jgi:hypothetical protein
MMYGGIMKRSRIAVIVHIRELDMHRTLLPKLSYYISSTHSN